MGLREAGPSIIFATSLLTVAACSSNPETESLKPIHESIPAEVQLTIGSTAVETTVEPTTIPPTTELAEIETATSSSTSTTIARETTTTTEYIPTWEDEHYLPKEVLQSGVKIADIQVTNPDGTLIVDIPLFALQKIYDSDVYHDLLERGAVLEVANPDINPEDIVTDFGVPDGMGLPGENGTVIIFGHRVSYINPDWDGNPFNGYEGDSQRVFERLDELETGAILSMSFTEIAGGEIRQYEFLGLDIYENVETGGGSIIRDAILNARTGPKDNEYIRLLACTPKGSTRDRIAANFVLVQN